VAELEGAMLLKVRKAAGLSGILPEMVLYGGPVLLELFRENLFKCCDHQSLSLESPFVSSPP